MRRFFSAAGSGPAPAGFGFGTDAVGLLRGFAEDTIVGDHVAVGNLDYRLPLARIQRGLGTLPFFLRTAHAAIFADAGHAWSDAVSGGPISALPSAPSSRSTPSSATACR